MTLPVIGSGLSPLRLPKFHLLHPHVLFFAGLRMKSEMLLVAWLCCPMQ